MVKNITQDDVIYFIVTDRFFGRNKLSAETPDNKIHGGTLDGILEKLDYLRELGITAIWVTPVYQNIPEVGSSEPYHYYWPSHFDRMDTRLLDGTLLPLDQSQTTFGKFVDQCESKDFKVILDMVVNHAGYGAKPLFDPTWFNNGKGDIEGELAGLPDFDHDNPDVLDFFIKNIESWIVNGKVSNIRMDTVKHVEQKFWHYFKNQIRGQYPDTSIIGEVLFEGKNDIAELLQYQNFHNFDSIFDFPTCTALRSTLIYDESIQYWLARPRLNDDEPLGVLDNDNPLKGGYRNANKLTTLLDNHDLSQRIMSHSRSKHPGSGNGLSMAIKVTKLCLGALFTIRGIPQLYYGTEIGMEGWKDDKGDCNLRRDFPWHCIAPNNHPKDECEKEKQIYDWTKALIQLRKSKDALKYGTTITLWSDHLVYAFLRIALDDVVFVVINNGYEKMQTPLRIQLNAKVIPLRIINLIKRGLRHWQNGNNLTIDGNFISVIVDGKSIDIFC